VLLDGAIGAEGDAVADLDEAAVLGHQGDAAGGDAGFLAGVEVDVEGGL
jgi:hypothetical protein